ncbi:unnamed protein product [Clonostachys solani]|uniref:Enoyl reductase (ER) domain-containing protein n=1 Tax=Clonostachys solani TaxID=160281 RepID=A0A9N9Z1H8_9HYPO|nr:unnamed protein product [Clonostachys solani]
MTIDKSKTHKAALLYGAKSLKLTTVDTPPLGSHEVQVAPKATGICGTDMHYYQNGRNGIYTIESPLVLGHEAAGEVVAVGSDVHGLKPGDRVAVEPQLACFVCPKCRLGQYNMCSSMRFLGSASARPPASGSLQQLYNHPASLVYRLPDSLSYLEGAMVEPLSVAIHSVRKARLQAGQTVLITGAGAIGLLCASVARISGALRIAMVDVDGTRLEFAKAQGLADATMLIPFGGNEGETSIEFSTRMAKELSSSEAGMRPADVAFECSGVESCLNLCVASESGRFGLQICGIKANPVSSMKRYLEVIYGGYSTVRRCLPIKLAYAPTDWIHSSLLALNHPRLLRSLVLLDPVIQERNGSISPAKASTPRRDIWPSRQTAAARFNGGKFFQTWDPRVLDRWIEYGLRRGPTELYPRGHLDNDDGVTLTTSKHQELFTFLRPTYRHSPGEKYVDKDPVSDEEYPGYPFYRPEPLQVFRRLPEMRPSVLYIFGGSSELSRSQQREKKMVQTGVGVGGSGGAVAGRVKEVVLDCGHLVAMEKVSECADAITAFLESELELWRKEKREFERYWNKKSRREQITIDKAWADNIDPSMKPSGRNKL